MIKVVFLLLCFSASSCFADCRGTVLNNTKAVDRDGSKQQCVIYKDIKGKDLNWCPEAVERGAKLSDISQYIKNKKNQQPVYCIHGGNCFPAKDISVSNPCVLGIFED